MHFSAQKFGKLRGGGKFVVEYLKHCQNGQNKRIRGLLKGWQYSIY